jgi:acyl carrier protein phosphodiesterase
MSNTNETNNAGIRWLSVFEQVATALIIAAVLGIAALLYNTQTLNQSFNNMNDKFDQLAKRFEDIETRTDKRIGNEEIEVEVDELPLVF